MQCVGGLASGLFKVVVADGAARVCVGGFLCLQIFLVFVSLSSKLWIHSRSCDHYCLRVVEQSVVLTGSW